jgi:hypothetical protein
MVRFQRRAVWTRDERGGAGWAWECDEDGGYRFLPDDPHEKPIPCRAGDFREERPDDLA